MKKLASGQVDKLILVGRDSVTYLIQFLLNFSLVLEIMNVFQICFFNY